MIRFNIIGTGFLDFEEHGNLAFTAQNQWFRFAEVSMSRSVEFTIPATERNKKMLGYGEDVNNYGDMLRVNHECQMVYDGGAMMGTLSVTAYEGDAFKCVFFLKSAPWIDRLQELKLSDCPTSFTKGVPWTAVATVEDADTADPTQECLIVNYENGISGYAPNWQLVPSVNVKAFIEDILGNLGVPFSGDLDDSFWMIAGSMKGGDTDFVTFGATATNNVTISQSQGYFTIESITIEWARSNVFGMYVGGGSTLTQGYKATQDVEMTFGASVAKPLFLIKWNSRLGRCEVLGGSKVGGPVAGVNPLDYRTVSVKKGDIIFFAKNAFFDLDANGTYFGWKDIAYPMSETCMVARSRDLTLGETWQLCNNMPDMTVFEFLKSVALATGLELSVSPSGVVLGNAVYGKKFVPIENVVSIDSVERIVESWGNDTISALTNFDSEEYVTEPLVSRHDIDNHQRQSEAVHTSKFSEGNLGNTSNNVEVLDVSVEGGVYKFAAKKWTICRAVNGETYLQRVVLPNPFGYDDIADNSTCVKMKMATGEAAFFALEAETTFLWRGAAFVWTEANWSGGIMNLTLQRVSQAYVEASPIPPVTLVSINASFNQGGATIYDTDDINDLKQYLTVVASYDNGLQRTLNANEYTLSGTLAAPSSTITVSFEGQTDTFTVQVTHVAPVLTGISATFTQGGATIYDTDDINDLKQYLAVVASYSDGTTAAVSSSDYTLSGSLVAPSSTITVSYGGFSDTFTVLVTHQEVLPYDAEVEYLESDGSQKINTPIVGTNDVKIEAKFQLTATTQRYLFGTSESSSTTSIRAYIGSSANWRFGKGYRAMNTANTNVHTFVMSKTNIVYDGTTYSWGTALTNFSDGNISIFNLRTTSYGALSRFYYFKIYDNNVLVFDGIPVRVGSVGYLYDKVSETLFGNDGMGDFVVGADV